MSMPSLPECVEGRLIAQRTLMLAMIRALSSQQISDLKRHYVEEVERSTQELQSSPSVAVLDAFEREIELQADMIFRLAS
ncbi:hypothetical protein RBI14_17115 [Alcaligenaceae bacterium B3P038]|nr:hypothetical protein [Alcaligenaceae bacterium B3P038]